MEKYRFYREEDGRWYVDLPEWTGDKEELEMVSGADLLLEALGHGEAWVSVELSTDYVADWPKLTHVGDGFYSNDAWHGPSTIWLCSVTEWVFGYYPLEIWYN